MSFTERAIPDLSHHRAIKERYLEMPIDTGHPLFDEPVVSLWEYGIRGHSYYSGPNKATGEPLPGINPDPLVRRSTAERLVKAKDSLWNNDPLTRHLGGRAELIVKDALRSNGLQDHLYEVIWPKILRDANPDWSDERITEELPKVVGKPRKDPSKPAPHTTGGPVDVDLINEDGTKINFGHVRGNTLVSQPDFHEARIESPEVPADPFARIVRRALYWSMLEQGFASHPYEFWHYSYGDQMWALFTDKPAAIYGGVDGAPDLL